MTIDRDMMDMLFPEKPSININEQFSNGAFLLGASDAQLEWEIQCFMDKRIHVASLYQDDMPGYNASASQPYFHMEARIDYARKFLADAFPTMKIQPDDKCFKEIAESRSAQITSFRTNGEITHFCILKPARSLSPKQKLADTMGLDPQFISLNITKQESDFLETHHEIGHLKYNVLSGCFSNSFQEKHNEELSADQGSLCAYWIEQEAPSQRHRVTSYLVAMRAVSGFLCQPPIYWFAPALEDCLEQSLVAGNTTEFKLHTNPWENFLAYSELRMRTASSVIDGNALNNFSSKQLKQAITIWDHNAGHPDNRLPIENPELARATKFLNHWYSSEFRELRYNGTLLCVLSQEVMPTHMDDFSRSCASQILRSTEYLCAHLALDQTANPDFGAGNPPDRKPR